MFSELDYTIRGLKNTQKLPSDAGICNLTHSAYGYCNYNFVVGGPNGHHQHTDIMFSENDRPIPLGQL